MSNFFAYYPATPDTVIVSGTVTANQGTSPWVVSGAVSASQSGTWNIGTVTTLTNITNPVSVTQNTSPWVISGTVTADAGTGTFLVDGSAHTQPVSGSLGRTWTLSSGTDSVAVTGSITTSPDVNIHDSAGNTLASTGTSLNVDVTNTVPVSQSGAWTTGRTWTLASGTDSIASVQSGTWNIGTVTTITNPVAVTQSTSPWVISGTVTANAGTNLNTSLLALDTSVNGILLAQNSTTSGQTGPLIQGAVTTAAPSYTTAKTSPLSLTTTGALRIDGSGSTQPISGTVAATQSGTWNIATVTTLTSITNPVAVTQSGSWTVLSSNFPTTVDTNYGTVGASTLRAAAQIGNSTGAADFNAGSTGAQTLRVTANAGTNLNTSLLALDATLTNKTQFTKLTDGTDTGLITAAGELNVLATAQPGIDIGDVTINNGTGASAVNIQDGGNTITVDGAVTATLSSETTKVIGVVRNADGSGNLLTSTSFNSKQGLDVTPNTGFSTASNTRVAVDNSASVQLLAANLNRRYVSIMNNTGKAFYLKLGASAVVGQGILLSNNGMYEITQDNLWTGTVNAISSSSTSSSLDIFEGTP